MLLMACHSEKRQDDVKKKITQIKIEKKEYDFGTISPKDSVHGSFLIENIGKKPLIIYSALASCGCTTPSWTRAPVMVGKTAKISFIFKPTADYKGVVKKSIVFQANTKERFHVLYLYGNVSPQK